MRKKLMMCLCAVALLFAADAFAQSSNPRQMNADNAPKVYYSVIDRDSGERITGVMDRSEFADSPLASVGTNPIPAYAWQNADEEKLNSIKEVLLYDENLVENAAGKEDMFISWLNSIITSGILSSDELTIAQANLAAIGG